MPSTSSPVRPSLSPVQIAPAVPPQTVSPPYAKSAFAGDGQWQAMTLASDGKAVNGLWMTTLHPHPISRFVTVMVVAIDLKDLQLHWVIGAADPGAELLAPFMSPGLVNQAMAPDAVAVFNGGFLARHGHWGQVSHGQRLVPPKVEGCGVALFSSHRVALGAFSEFDSDPDLLTYRQTPPCLVSEGRVATALVAGHDQAWAGKSQRRKTRRRSALGVNVSADTLYYLVGNEATPLDLARALVALNVDTGLQLDINWNWTRFFLVGPDERGEVEVQQTLIDGMVYDHGEYFSRPSKRDFFWLRRTAEAPAADG